MQKTIISLAPEEREWHAKRAQREHVASKRLRDEWLSLETVRDKFQLPQILPASRRLVVAIWVATGAVFASVAPAQNCFAAGDPLVETGSGFPGNYGHSAIYLSPDHPACRDDHRAQDSSSNYR